MEYSFTLALFVLATGLAYHTIFILAPVDLMDKRIPAIVAVISWSIIGFASGAVIPAMYARWEDYIATTIAGIVFIYAGAIIGHVVVTITRRRVQNEVAYIASQIYHQEKSGTTEKP